jgi:ABC-2 type transport system ATP-binding protein
MPVTVIATNALTKRYGELAALDALTVEVPEGVVGLVGANGAGKSTLIKILLGLLPATSGRASVFGLDVASNGMELRSKIGYMPEHDCLPPDVTATELVVHLARMSGLPPTAARERAADTLRHVGLYEERYRLVGGYSTGMKQRVKLAQALVHDPQLIMLDEPTNGLDPAGRDEMLDLISRIGHEFGVNVLVTSHLLGELERISDHVVVVQGGRLVRSTSTASATTGSDVLTIELTDRVEEFVGLLVGAGHEVGRTDAPLTVDVRLTGDATYDAVRDAAAHLRIGLVRLQRQRHHLSEIFVRDGGHLASQPVGGDPR